MNLWLTGMNHRTAPVEVRERLAFGADALPQALRQLRSLPGLSEGLILSTCNRVEVVVTAEDHADAAQSIRCFLSEWQKVDPEWIQPHLYSFAGRDAIRHLFRVAASLDSMIVGEPQILGQLKTAYQAAKAEGALSGQLEAVIAKAFRVAKRVRTETDIGSSAVSVSYAAVELAREIFGSLANRKVMLIGAGKMSELAAKHLLRSGAAQILVTNRTPERARQVAELVHGSTAPYESMTERLPAVDIVITSSAAPEYVLTKPMMRRILEARRNRPMFLIDIAVPRNIEPAVNELDNVFVYDIDDLQRLVERNLKGRLDEAAEAEKIVAEEVDRIEQSFQARRATPMIVSLNEQLERVRQAEVERMRGKLGSLTPQQEEALEALTRGIIGKIAHGPISELRREAASPNGGRTAELIRRIFRLDE